MTTSTIFARASLLAFALGSTMIAGCAADAGDSPAAPEDVGAAASPVVNGTLLPAGDARARSTVEIGGYCTGVIIGQRHVLTAAHCTPTYGDEVRFYNGADPLSSPILTIANVWTRPGVNAYNGDLTDVDGKWADIALLELSGNIPSTSLVAELPLFYPGGGTAGFIVGAGSHDNCNPAYVCFNGQPNPGLQLRSYQTTMMSGDNGGGDFLLNETNVNPGDSGGPFYTWNPSTGRYRVQGVLYGIPFDLSNLTLHAKYTSVEAHLTWILQTMGYTGGFISSPGYVRQTPAYLTWSTTNRLRCTLSCAQDAACKTYNYDDIGGVGICHQNPGTAALTPQVYTTTGARFSL